VPFVSPVIEQLVAPAVEHDDTTVVDVLVLYADAV
jgi:hypothetical protein